MRTSSTRKRSKMVVTAPGYAPIEYIADLRDVHTPVTIQKDFEMERTLAFPKDLNVNITFVSESGTVLKPNATYRLNPDIKDDTILPFKRSTGVIKIPLMSKYRIEERSSQHSSACSFQSPRRSRASKSCLKRGRLWI